VPIADTQYVFGFGLMTVFVDRLVRREDRVVRDRGRMVLKIKIVFILNIN
jgi:hypothetical protein